MADKTSEALQQEVQARYPRTETLRDGTSIEIHLMSDADRDNVLQFARALSHDDLLFLRSNITDPEVVDDWLGHIADGSTTTVLAYDRGALIGDGTLHHSVTTWTRHIGEIRLLIGEGGRGRGLGRVLAEEIYAIAKILGLRMLTAQITFDQHSAVTIFRRLGFQREAVLRDYVVDADGGTRDLLVATRRL